MPSHFSPAALRFLRGLARHNDREWFGERKTVFEAELKAPMLALIDEINAAMDSFAPDHVRPAAKCMMRIYRDTRFSKDKRPYKTNIAAWWARAGMEKTSGAGFYLALSGTELTVAAGAYLPERDQMLAIRRMLERDAGEYRRLAGSRELQALLSPIDGMPLTRSPKGFDPESPAADLVRQRQWGVGATLPALDATHPQLLDVAVRRFAVAAPLVRLLNSPFAQTARKPLF